MSGLYVHFPFCRSKCPYCSFYSLPQRPADEIEHWFSALLQEARLRRNQGWQAFETLYVGGGTPSLLSPALLERLVEGLRACFNLSQLAEFTLEANPESCTPEFLQAAAAVGATRLSLGVQSLDDTLLQRLGRPHDAKTAKTAAARIKENGLGLSVDLIYGIEGLSAEDWRENLRQALDLEPEHFSCYALAKGPGVKAPQPASSDDQAEQYEITCQVLEQAGYVQYEVSNFALPGCQSLHNLKYWRGARYLGLGPAAHSFDGRRRFANPKGLGLYLELARRGQVPCTYLEEPAASQRRLEKLALGLRTSDKLFFVQVEGLGGAPRDEALTALSDLEQEGFLEVDDTGFTAMRKGRLFADALAVHLQAVLDSRET